MSGGQEAGFRIIDVAPRRAIGPFKPHSMAVTVEAVGEPSILITSVHLSSSPLEVLKVRRIRIDFLGGEQLTGAAPERDRPALGAILTPDQLRDLGWCRRELNKRLRTGTSLS
jgi:hypothetical protein